MHPGEDVQQYERNPAMRTPSGRGMFFFNLRKTIHKPEETASRESRNRPTLPPGASAAPPSWAPPLFPGDEKQEQDEPEIASRLPDKVPASDGR